MSRLRRFLVWTVIGLLVVMLVATLVVESVA
jgi:hypothetical protein